MKKISVLIFVILGLIVSSWILNAALEIREEKILDVFSIDSAKVFRHCVRKAFEVIHIPLKAPLEFDPSICKMT